MDKDITYYQHVAEEFYLSHFAEIKREKDEQNASLAEYNKQHPEIDFLGEIDYSHETYRQKVNVNTKDNSCFFPKYFSSAVRPQELLFSCWMEDGKVQASFMEDGKDKVAEMLGLVDQYDKSERVEVDFVRKEDGYLHRDLPERFQKYDKEFYKVKLYRLDEFVDECNYTGWGDCFTRNILEVIAGVMKQGCIDFEKMEIHNSLNWYVGPGDTEDGNYYAEFEFSHCEVAKDDDDDKTGWAVFFCYKYAGMEEYEDDFA